jgi:predicted PurR-regulated permease PerM
VSPFVPEDVESPVTLKPKNFSSVFIALAGAAALLYFGQLLWVTLIVAIIIAFILEPFVVALMRIRLPRALASFVVCVMALLVLYMVGLGLYAQVASLYREIETYTSRIGDLVGVVTTRVEKMEQSTYQLLVGKRDQERQKLQEAQAPPPGLASKSGQRRRSAEPPAPIGPPPVQEVRILQERTLLVDYLFSHLGSVYDILLMSSFVPFLVYFMLSWRDHLHRAFLHLFQDQSRVIAGNSLERIASMVRGFVVGNFALGMFLAVLSSIMFSLFRLPYPLLTGPLSAFLSLIPYAGLPLAMLPPLFAALPVYQTMPPYILIGSAVGVLHLVALNLLYPKIVGAQVHLNPLVVTIALMVWGVLWGAPGLVLAIPLTAAIKAVCDNVGSLRSYGRLLGD